MWIFCIINAIHHIQYTSLPCRYRQNTGFAGPWEWATLTRRREPSSPVTRTHRLMKQPTAQHGGVRMKHVTVERVIMAAVMFMFIILNILIDPSNFFCFPDAMIRWNKQPYVYQKLKFLHKSMYNPVSNKANPCPASHTLLKSSYFCICIYPHNLQGSRCRHSIPNTRVSNISKPRNAMLHHITHWPCSTTSPTQRIPEWLYRSAMHVLSFSNTSRIHFKLFRLSAFIVQVNLNPTWSDPSTTQIATNDRDAMWIEKPHIIEYIVFAWHI